MKLVISNTESVDLDGSGVSAKIAMLRETYGIDICDGKAYYNDAEDKCVVLVDDAADISAAVTAGDAKDVTDHGDRDVADNTVLAQAEANHDVLFP